MDVVGGTFVGGSSNGWEIADQNANAAALGLVATPAVSAPVLGGGMTFGSGLGATAPYGGTLAFGGGLALGGGTMAPMAGYDPYAAAGTVGGSWSPEPAGNNQILYGHYSASGAVTMPQSFAGQQAATVAPQLPAAPAASSQPATTTAGGAPSTGGGGQAQQAPKAEPKKAEPKRLTVKAGDTLSELAVKHGTTTQRLYELNKGVIGSNPNLIRTGQVLRLP